MKTGEHAWMKPNGAGPIDHPALADLDLDPLGWPSYHGVLVTKTLLFVSGRGSMRGGGDTQSPILYVRDKATGELITEIALPAGAVAAPMTYALDDKQYLALPVGQRGEAQSLVVWTLPG